MSLVINHSCTIAPCHNAVELHDSSLVVVKGADDGGQHVITNDGVEGRGSHNGGVVLGGGGGGLGVVEGPIRASTLRSHTDRI